MTTVIVFLALASGAFVVWLMAMVRAGHEADQRAQKALDEWLKGGAK